MSQRDEFNKPVRDTAARRAAYICSNPECRVVCVSADPASPEGVLFIGKVAHIHAAAPGGARYDFAQSVSERKGIGNALFLCAVCAEIIDRNGGVAHPAETLRAWRERHETWVGEQLNRRKEDQLIVVDGTHSAEGTGTVVGLDIETAALIQPGTRSHASGHGTVIGTRIGGPARKE